MKTKRHKRKIIGCMGSTLIGNDPFHPRSWSGSSRFFFKTCEKYGVLARAFGVEVPRWIKVPLMLRNFSPNRERWRQKFYLDTTYYDKLAGEIYKCLSEYDLHQFNLLQIGGIYNLPKLINGKCKCFSYHDGNLMQLIKSPYMPEGISNKKIQTALQYEKTVYEGLDKIFTMSEYLRQSFINDFGIEEKKVIKIGCGINFSKVQKIEQKEYDKKNIVFVGIRFFRKGGETLLKAFEEVIRAVPKATLHIIGPPKVSIPNSIASRVITHGFLSRDNAAQKAKFDRILLDASLFVLPSRYEPFGIAPLEAMANGIPCILTNRWAFPEMVNPEENGYLIDLDDAADLANKIIFLLKYPEKLKTMGLAARSKVARNFSWDKVAGNLIKEI